MKNPMMFTPTVLIILCSLLPLSVRSQQGVFEENFNSLKLGPSQEEGVKKNVGPKRAQQNGKLRPNSNPRKV